MLGSVVGLPVPSKFTPIAKYTSSESDGSVMLTVAAVLVEYPPMLVPSVSLLRVHPAGAPVFGGGTPAVDCA